MHLDHIFILVSPGAPEADALLDIGLVEGTSNEHPGQGTANRRFFLENTTIEFLYIKDIAQAVNGAGKELKLVERAIDIDSSPFGLVTRVSPGIDIPGFPSWRYFPDYFPKPMCFYVGENSDNFSEPLCICMPPALPTPKKAPEPNNSGWSLTELQISIPGIGATTALNAFGECELVTIRYNEDHRVKLVLNNAKTGEYRNFMPDLPLIIEW